MEVWKAAVLGIVQGVTEFLPVSSSGHLLLFGRLLGADTGGADMYLGVMLHAGTLAAVLAVFAPRLWQMIRRRKPLALLALATVPGALAGLFLGDLVDALFFGGAWLWAAFALTAALLFACGRVSKRQRLPRPLGAKNAFLIGCAQAAAIVPGLSRSGVTLAAGVFCGLSRGEAADFSFLMSIPIIAGAIAAEAFKSAGNAAYASAVSWQCLFVGTLCAAVFGFLSIRVMLRAVKKSSLTGFSVYLALLSAALLALRFAA